MDLIARQRIYVVDAKLVELPDYNDKSKLVEKLNITRVVIEDDDTIRPKSIRQLYFTTGVVRRLAPSYKKLGVRFGDKSGKLLVGDTVDDMIGRVFEVELRDINWGPDMVSRDIPFATAVDDAFDVTPEFESTLDAMMKSYEEERAARQADANGSASARTVAEKWEPTEEQEGAITEFLKVSDGHLVDIDEAKTIFKTYSAVLHPIKRQVLDGSLVNYLVAHSRLTIGG